MATATNATATTGRLMRKTQPHQACDNSQPPSTGPSGNPSIVTDIITPTARPRSDSSKRKGTAASAIGKDGRRAEAEQHACRDEPSSARRQRARGGSQAEDDQG